MFGFWEQFVLHAVLGILAGLKRNPANAGAFRTILIHIVEDICVILQVAPPDFSQGPPIQQLK